MEPLVDDAVLREQLALLEADGLEVAEQLEEEVILPPVSVRRPAEFEPVAEDELKRLRKVVREHGLALHNAGAVYRCHRQSSFEWYTLRASPLVPEQNGGGEANALLEIVKRFC